MITVTTMPNTPLRSIKAKVELYKGSTLAHTFRYNDDLVSFDIDRVGEEGKFFGFGITQKITIKIRDINREYEINNGDYFLLYIGANDEEIDFNTSQPYFPKFYVEETKRDEKTNELTIVAYDALYKATKVTVEDVGLSSPYSMETAVGMTAAALNISFDLSSFDELQDLYFEQGANFEGTETANDVLRAAAEATQSVYFIKHENGDETLVLKKLDFINTPVLTIDKANYFELTSEPARKLTAISHITELGDNLIASTGEDGETQYIKDNPFLELREDLPTLLEQAIAAIGGATIHPFTCSWRGNYLLEPGDKIELITKDNDSIISFVINDKMTYNGGFSGSTSWSYDSEGAATSNNATTIGEVIKQTYAKVDKANRQIELVASETDANRAALASLQLDTESISASVKNVEDNTEQALAGVNSDIEMLTTQVQATITSEEVSLLIESERENGANRVTTSTGFTFDEAGLTIDKAGSEMKTQITEDGMSVFRDNTEVLTANNTGVKARNLHADTYLIIGTNSRFEDYGTGRTGCFWIGG